MPSAIFYLAVQRAKARAEQRAVAQLEDLCNEGHFGALKLKLQQYGYGVNAAPNLDIESSPLLGEGDDRLDLTRLNDAELALFEELHAKALVHGV